MSALEAIKARAAAATEGPWEADTSGMAGPDDSYTVYDESGAIAYCQPVSEDAEFIAHAREDVPRLVAVAEAVLALHKPEKRWTHPDWTGSFDTREEAAQYDDDFFGDPAKSEVEFFEVCAECGRVEAEQWKETGDEWKYREAMWPCPTVTAIRTALEGTR